MTSSGTTIRNLSVALMLVVVAFGAYFFLYMQQRERLLAQHHLRLLLNAGSYASDRLEGVLGNVTYAVSLSDSEVTRALGKTRGSGDQATTDAIEAKFGLVPELDKWSGKLLGRQSREEFLQDKGVVPHIGTVRESKPARDVYIAVALDILANDVHVVFTSWRSSRPEEKLSVVSRQADLRKLISPTLPVDFFDGVVLARSNGDVLLEEGSSQLRLRKLEPPKPAKGAPETPGLPVSQVYDVTVAGERYKFFVQPIPLPIRINYRAPASNEWNLEDYWLVAGFIPAGRYQAMSMAISPTIVLVAVGLIALGLLCLPILKVRHLGAREELRQVDVLVLAIAIIVATSLVTYAVLFYGVHEEGAEGTKDTLERLSGDISQQLGTDLSRLDDALVSLTRRRLTRGGARFENSILASSMISSPPAPRDASRWTPGGPAGVAGDSLRYPFLEMAIWMDEDGFQKAKWSIRAETTPLSKADDRQYFNDPVRSLLWAAPGSTGMYEAGHVVESIRSKTTSQEFAMLARRLSTPYSSAVAVGAIESRLLSVMSPVLPPGLGFAIVDRNGLVQFHSDPVRNIRENLLQELGSDVAVRTAVASGQVTITKTTYRTVPTVLRVAPIPRTPWSLIVFEDIRAPRSWLLEVLTLALLLYTLHLLAFLAVAMALFIGLKPTTHPGEVRRLWYWPWDRHRRRYAGLIVVFAALGLAWVLVVSIADEKWIAWSSFGVSIAALLLFHAGLRTTWLDGWRLSGFDRLGTHSLYLVLMTVFALVVGALPACGYWRVVYDEESVLRLKGQQIAFASAMNARRLEKLRWYRDVRLGDAAYEAIAGNVRPESSEDGALGFYAPPGWSWRYVPAGTPEPGDSRHRSRQSVIENIRMLLTRSGVPAASIEPSAAGEDSSYHWYSMGRDTLACVAVNPVPAGRLGKAAGGRRDTGSFQTLTLSGPAPSLDFSRAPLYWLLMALAEVALLAWVLRVSLRCVFLYHSAPRGTVDGKAALAKGPPVPNAMLLRFHLGEEERGKCHLIDIGDIRGAENAKSLVDKFEKSGKSRALLTRFDRGLTEKEIVVRKLELLEGLNALNPAREVTIESSVEPLYFLTSRFNDHYEERKELGIAIDRWALALQGYIRLREPTLEAPAAAARAGVPEGVQALEDECAPNDMLRRIGKHLRQHASFEEKSRAEVVETVLDMAQAHYRRIWSICSTEEKLLLFRIAKEGFANRNAGSVLRPLVRRGLVFMDPNCRLMNDSFRKFVLSAERPEVLAKWQQRGGVSAWSRMKGPILLSVAVLGTFFFATQREAFNQSLGLVTALAASAPGLISLVGGLSKLGQPAAPRN